VKIAIIPARGGSKRIKNKNIRNFNGKPIIKVLIEKLNNFKIFDYIFVSTDSEEIKQVSQTSGALVPFLRDKKLADDMTPTQPVIIDSIKNLEKNYDFDSICCIYPTSVFLRKQFLESAFDLLQKNTDSLISPFCLYSTPIDRALKKEGDSFKFYKESKSLNRTQDLRESYFDAAQFYLGNKSTWLKSKNIVNNSKGIVIPEKYVQDIDTIEDWETAELKYRLIKEN